MKSRVADLRHLQAFTSLAEELHFGRAARRLGITQSALSQVLRDLETKVGTALIERTTRRVALTVPGSVFLEDARAILSRMDRAIERARDTAGLRGETIRIGAGLHCAFSFLPLLLKAYRKRYPSIVLKVEILQSDAVVRALEARALDVGLLRPPAENGSLQVRSLYREPFLAAMPNDHPLAEKTILTINDLREGGVIRITRPDLREAFTSLDLEINGPVTEHRHSSSVDSTMAALALIFADGGVSLVPAWASQIPWSGLIFRPVEDLETSITLSVAWRADRQVAAVANFVELAVRAGRRGAPRTEIFK